ncbi:oligosaccharide flippase family protein [Capnocytophaga sputigena]|uniref:oligosaccharide flippase family protein n=1 Tax=Capnocytophaga sputigena TaxID=1019 RepID=UPI0031F4DFF3
MKNKIHSFLKTIRNNKKIIENYFFMTLLLALNSYFALLIYPYLIKSLGKESYGIYVYGFTIASFFTTFVSFGFDMTGLREVSKVPHSTKDKSFILSKVFTAKLYLEIISIGIFAILVNIISLWEENSLIYWVCFSTTLVNIFLPVWYFQGIQKMKVVTIIQLLLKIASLPFIFYYVRKSSDILIYSVISSLVSVVGSLIAFAYIIKIDKVKLSIISFKKTLSYTKESLYFFYSNVGSTIKTQSLNLIIGSYFGMGDLAIYDLAQKIISIPMMILMNVNRAIFPKIAGSFNIVTIKKILRYEHIVGILVVISIILLGNPIVILLGGEGMELAYPIAIILSFVVYGFLITTCHLDLIITPLKLDIYIFKNQMIALITLFLSILIGFVFSRSIFILPTALVLSAFSEVFYQRYILYKKGILKL